jgi:phosphoenolpyruvate synthase/pyruvate phosphate dikinase
VTPAARKARQFVYAFGGGHADGNAKMKDLLGGKGANLAEMAEIGLPVPPGFTISTEVCTYFYAHGRRYPGGLSAEVAKALHRVEQLVGKRFGDPANPLLVSVRSGARASMPGMMDNPQPRSNGSTAGDRRADQESALPCSYRTSCRCGDVVPEWKRVWSARSTRAA